VDKFPGHSVSSKFHGLVEPVKGAVFMPVELSSQQFRGVLCHHCGKPVRVPKIVLRKDSENHGQRTADDNQFQLISRVFVLRCRACERESIYAIDQIVDCQFSQTNGKGLAQAAY
jgi:hypothetical protein